MSHAHATEKRAFATFIEEQVTLLRRPFELPDGFRSSIPEQELRAFVNRLNTFVENNLDATFSKAKTDTSSQSPRKLLINRLIAASEAHKQAIQRIVQLRMQPHVQAAITKIKQLKREIIAEQAKHDKLDAMLSRLNRTLFEDTEYHDEHLLQNLEKVTELLSKTSELVLENQAKLSAAVSESRKKRKESGVENTQDSLDTIAATPRKKRALDSPTPDESDLRLLILALIDSLQ